MDKEAIFHLNELFPHVTLANITSRLAKSDISDAVHLLLEDNDKKRLDKALYHLQCLFPNRTVDQGLLSTRLSHVPSYLNKLHVALDYIVGQPQYYGHFQINPPVELLEQTPQRKRSCRPIRVSTYCKEKQPKMLHNLDQPSTSQQASNYQVNPSQTIKIDLVNVRNDAVRQPPNGILKVKVHAKRQVDDIMKKSPVQNHVDDLINLFLPQTSQSQTQTIQPPPMNILKSTDRQVKNLVNDLTNSLLPQPGQSQPQTSQSQPPTSHSQPPTFQNPPDKEMIAYEESFKLVNELRSIFPNASRKYLLKLVDNRPYSEDLLNILVDTMLQGYPITKKPVIAQPRYTEEGDIDFDTQIEILKGLLPDADPNYLENYLHNCKTMAELRTFIDECMEYRRYPKLQDLLKKQKLNAQIRQYTTEFNIDDFLKLIPDPETYFQEEAFQNPNLVLNNFEDVLNFLKQHFPKIAIRTIRSTMESKRVFLHIFEALQNHQTFLKKARPIYSAASSTNIPLLQMFAYTKNKTNILLRLQTKKQAEAERRKMAIENNEVITCPCCCDEEIMVEEIVCCPNRCKFCKHCVRRSVEIKFAECQLNFDCLLNCGASFTLVILQSALPPKLFSKIAQRKQMEEVKAAGIEDLEQCPFCDFATIPPAEDRIFKCLNSECMKESCRLCKEPSHVPLRCEEVEADVETKRRTYIENKMTEALLRECWKCKIKFIKSDGCNKMTCSCGALMCYLCKEPVKNYNHFYGQGSYDATKCPLYSNTELLHAKAAVSSGMAAKEELGNVQLKIDPLYDAQERLNAASKAKNQVPMPRGPM